METAEPNGSDRHPDGAFGGPIQASTVLRVVRDPTVFILMVAGIVDVVTGDPAMHGLALVAVAAVLIRDGLTRGDRSSQGDARGPTTRTWPRFRFTPTLVAVGVLYAVLVGWFGRFSWPLTIGIAVPGILEVTVAWRSPVSGPDPAPLDPVGRAAWLAVFLSLAAWEIQALLLQPTLTTSSWDHPTLSTLMDPVLAGHLGRSITMILWLAVGGYLLRLVER